MNIHRSMNIEIRAENETCMQSYASHAHELAISKMHSVRFFLPVHPLVRFGNCQSQSKMENDKECMMHETRLHFISIHTWANRRYSVTESQTSRWINQADLHIPSMNIYSFLFGNFVSVVVVVAGILNALQSNERIEQSSFCVELNFWWNSLA